VVTVAGEAPSETLNFNEQSYVYPGAPRLVKLADEGRRGTNRVHT